MFEHPINGMMNSAMENLKEMVDVNTIVGDPVVSGDGTMVIPVSKVSFGLAAGGGEYSGKEVKTENTNPFAGGVGAGVSVNPIAFLVVTKTDVKLIPVQGEEPYSRLIEAVPTMVNKVASLFKNNSKEDTAEENLTEE